MGHDHHHGTEQLGDTRLVFELAINVLIMLVEQVADAQHNITDALAFLGVIVTGLLILLYGWHWSDTLLTFTIAAFVLYQGFTLIPYIRLAS
jgi:divalent metal cation (Fe/Co/Zn/Cd) transporter